MDKSVRLVQKITRDITFKGVNKGKCAQWVADLDIEEQQRKLKKIQRKNKKTTSGGDLSSPSDYTVYLSLQQKKKERKREKRVKGEKKKVRTHLERICNRQ